MVEGLSINVRHQKIKKKHWLKRPKAVPQIFVIPFLKILFPHVTVGIIRVFFIPEFVAENLKANKIQWKRSHSFYYSFAQKASLILQILTLLKLKIISSQNTSKNILIFQQACFCLEPEKTFALHHLLTSRTTFLKHFESKCLYIFVYLFKKFLFQRRIKIFLVVWRVGEAEIISLRRLAVWVLQNVLQFFILIYFFLNSTIFQHVDTFINSFETLIFSRQVGLRR